MIFWRKLIIFASKSSLRLQVDAEQPWISYLFFMWKDIETHDDLLGYAVHARMLKNIITNDSMLPISIGVFGNWGSGKSSLMLILEDLLKTDPERATAGERILQIQFNSWQFENYENTKYALIEHILKVMSDDVNEHRKLFTKCKNILKRIKWLSGISLIFSKAKESLPTDLKSAVPTWDEMKDLIKEEDYKEVIRTSGSLNSTKIIARFRTDFEELVKEAQYKCVVIYIDDLDRCSPERVIQCLEAVKLFLNVSKTAFVIGADERIIEYAIEKHYPERSQQEGEYRPFSDYLEKLIQLPYKLPRLSRKEQETYITLLLCQQYLKNDFSRIYADYREFKKENIYAPYNLKIAKNRLENIDWKEVEKLIPIVPLMQSFLNGNPRRLKRFMNTLHVRLELAKAAEISEIDSAILAKLMTLEYDTMYRNRFEHLYGLRSENGDIEGIGKVEIEANNGAITDKTWKDWNVPVLINWLKSKPSLNGIDLTSYFWISRESLMEAEPVESWVSTRINKLYHELLQMQAQTVVQKAIENLGDTFTQEEKLMFVSLINLRLKQDPKDSAIWRILNADENEYLALITPDAIDRLFSNVATEQIAPEAKKFFQRLKGKDELKPIMDKIKLGKRLSKAIEMK